jgi:hypothetical protein
MASHNDVIAGVRPRTESKFLRFLARPTATLSSAEKIMFAPLMIFWVPMFFGLFAIPAIIGNALSVDDNVTVKVTYAVLSGALLIARKFGKRAWNALV